MLNAFVQGHWENMLARPALLYKVTKSLKAIRKMCMTLTETQKNHYHIKLTTMQIQSNEMATNYFRHFNTEKKHAEEAGLHYNNNMLVDLVLGALQKHPNPEYKIHALSYKAQRDQKVSVPFTTIENKFQSLDLSFDEKKRPACHQANVSSHTSVDTPSNKINRGTGFGRNNNSNNSRSSNSSNSSNYTRRKMMKRNAMPVVIQTTLFKSVQMKISSKNTLRIAERMQIRDIKHLQLKVK